MESQIFRIDHFLGKEAAQNILAFRFANGLFEPIWSRHFIDHVQIDIPEKIGLDERANFYESTGAFKDMVVTHLSSDGVRRDGAADRAGAPRDQRKRRTRSSGRCCRYNPADVIRGQFRGYRNEGGEWHPIRHETSHRH